MVFPAKPPAISSLYIFLALLTLLVLILPKSANPAKPPEIGCFPPSLLITKPSVIPVTLLSLTIVPQTSITPAVNPKIPPLTPVESRSTVPLLPK